MRKVWGTIGIPQLVVMSDYRMGFEIAEAIRAASFVSGSSMRCRDRGYATGSGDCWRRRSRAGAWRACCTKFKSSSKARRYENRASFGQVVGQISDRFEDADFSLSRCAHVRLPFYCV